MKVPFIGSHRYFRAIAESAPQPTIDADWSRRTSRPPRRGRDSAYLEALLRWGPPETVKAWVKGQIDAVEDYLEVLRADVEARALDLRRRAHEFAEHRLHGLRSEAALADGLGEGV